MYDRLSFQLFYIWISVSPVARQDTYPAESNITFHGMYMFGHHIGADTVIIFFLHLHLGPSQRAELFGQHRGDSPVGISVRP